jgi:hypothetical protein
MSITPTPVSTTPTFLGREPALWLGAIATVVQFVARFIFPLTPDEQGAINAVAVLALGAVTAFMVSAEKGVPALLGVLQGLLALGLAFNLHLDPSAQATIMGIATMIASLITRQLVVVPVPPKVSLH